MKHSEGTFTTSDGLELYFQFWKPEADPRAAVAIVHGHGEHCGRYMNVVDCLVPAGYSVHGFDLRGFGRSPGRRSYINSWSEYREDVRAFVHLVSLQTSNRPLFVYGHSLGALIALEYVLRHPEGLAGVILSAPPVGEIGLSPVLFLLSRVLSRVYPQFTLKTGLDTTALSRDSSVVQAYRDDPLVHGLGTARLGTELAVAREYAVGHVDDLSVPLLLIYGTADRICSPEGCRAFYDRVPLADKTRIEYAGGYHESHNDIAYKQVMTDIERWLTAHV